jgi:L-lysine 2,3-aminomutase
MLTGVHFLFSYQCTFECDHCFLHCSPRAGGTFTVAQLRDVFDQIARMPSVNEVYFEGGEPFLFHPLMVEGARLADVSV